MRGQYLGYRDEPGVPQHSETETFVALQCEIDNWRWAGVPFFLRTGKRMAEGARIISIAFREPPKSMFPPGWVWAPTGPTTSPSTSRMLQALAVVLREAAGPGDEARQAEPAVRPPRDGREFDVLEAYERLIYDAMSGDHTLFTTADGIERLWELSANLLNTRRPFAPTSLARGARTPSTSSSPRTRGGPFERTWRTKP